MKENGFTTILGILTSVFGAIQTVDLVPLLGDASPKWGTLILLIGAVLMALGKSPLARREWSEGERALTAQREADMRAKADKSATLTDDLP